MSRDLEPLTLTADGTVMFDANLLPHDVAIEGDFGGGTLSVIESGHRFTDLGMTSAAFAASTDSTIWEAVTNNGTPITYTTQPAAPLVITNPKTMIGFRLAGSTSPSITIRPRRPTLP